VNKSAGNLASVRKGIKHSNTDQDFGIERFKNNRTKSNDLSKSIINQDDDNMSLYIRNSKQARNVR